MFQPWKLDERRQSRGSSVAYRGGWGSFQRWLGWKGKKGRFFSRTTGTPATPTIDSGVHEGTQSSWRMGSHQRCRNPHGYEWPPVEGPVRTCLRTHGSSHTLPSQTRERGWYFHPWWPKKRPGITSARARCASTMREAVWKEKRGQCNRLRLLPTPPMITVWPINGISWLTVWWRGWLKWMFGFVDIGGWREALILVNSIMRKLDQFSSSDQWVLGLRVFLMSLKVLVV